MITNKALGGIAAICALWAVGCSGSDSGSGDPASQCNQLGESLCEANANCAVQTGLVTEGQRSTYTSNCVTGFKGALDCSRVTTTTGHPDVCQSDVASTSCSFFDRNTGLPIPASCQHIFQ